MKKQQTTKISGSARDRRTQRRFLTVQRATTTPQLAPRHGLRLPLYFGWELVIGANRIPDARGHIVGPFRTYRAFGFSVATIIVVLIGLGVFIANRSLQAATYTWTQNAWNTLTGNTAVHPTNQTGWTEYSAKDTNVSASGTVTLSPSNQLITETSDTDFNDGTYSNTQVSGTGAAAQVVLSQGALGQPVASTSYNLASSLSSSTYHFLAYDSTSSAVWGIRNSTTNITKMPTDGSAATSYTPAAFSHFSIAYSPSRHSLFLGSSDGKIREVSAANGTLVNTITPATNIIGDMVYDTTNNVIYFVSSGGRIKKMNPDGSGEVVCFDGNSNTFPDALLLNPTNTTLYFSSSFDTFTVMKISVPGCTDALGSGLDTSQINGLAYDTSTSSVWAVNYMAGYYKINATTLAVTASYTATISQPYTIAYDSTQSVLWIGNMAQAPYRLYKVSPADGSVIGSYTEMPASINTLRGSLFESTSKTLWQIASNGTNFATRWSLYGYASSGTFQSDVLDTGGNLNYSTASWTVDQPANTTTSVKFRTDPDGNFSDAPVWTDCGYTTGAGTRFDSTSGGPVIEANWNCVDAGERYAQYLVTLATTDANVTPSFSDVTLNYRVYADGTLTSSAFDSADATNVLAKLQFAQTTTGQAETDVVTDDFERASLGSSWRDYYDGGYARICNSSDFCGLQNFFMNWGMYADQEFSRDQFSEAVISAIDGSTHDLSADVIVRGNQNGRFNMYGLTTDGNSIFRIYRMVNDGETVLLNIGAPYPQAGDTLKLTAIGTTLTAYVNGVSRGSITDTALSSGSPGLRAYGTNGTGSFESWRGGNITTLGGSVKFQLQTSADGNSWGSWLGPTNGSDYYTDAAGNTAINSQQTDGVADRYMRYKAFVTAGSYVNGSEITLATPVLSSVTTTYVVNAPPEFQAAPTAVQNADGTVTINYSVRSPDTATDTGSIGLVTPSFEYSLDNGSHWSAITSGLPASATTPKAVEAVNYTAYSTIWTAKTQLDGTYAAQAKIRVTVSDLQAANATAQGESTAFVFDVKDPALGGTPISVDASTVPATINLSATDDTALQMCVTLDNTQTNCAAYSSSTTLALATDPDTVYVFFVDSKGNIASGNAVTPQTPSNLIIRDLSNVPTSEFQLFVTWAATSVPVGQFANYKVFHSTDGSNYSLLATIADKTINYYFHKSLSNGTTHYYKVSTTTTASNTSYFSSTISGIANGQGGGNDVVAPMITNVQTTSITTQSAIITWDTDELANSTVGFSTTPAVFTTEVGVATMLDTAAGVGRHSVTLNGLTPGTTYYYRVQSADPSSNEATDTNGGDGYFFTTVTGPVITNVTTTNVDNTTATITWLTNIGADSTVRYSTSATLASPTTVTVSETVTNHAVTLTGLTFGTKYYYEIASGVALDPNGGNFYSFTTTNDTQAPSISAIAVTPITDTQAVVTWTTNERATGQVAYGTSTGVHPNSSALVTTLNVNHAITLTGLSPNTTYTFVITSADGAANSTTSAEQTFTTLDRLLTEAEAQALVDTLSDTTAPKISAVEAQSVTATSANITWTTNEAANSFVKFGPSGADQIIYGNWVYDTAHTIPLLTLTPNTTYTYTVVSADTHGNITTAAAATFTTIPLSAATLEQQLQGQVQTIAESAQDLPGPTIGGQPAVTTTPTTAVITWITDKPANSLIAFATSSEYAGRKAYTQNVGDPDTYVTSHSVKISGLTADTEYHYRITSTTALFQTTTAADATFRTPKQAFAIDNYSIDTPNTSTAIFRWTTNDAASASLQVTPYRNNVLAVDEQLSDVDNTRSFIHQLTLDTLEPGVRYQVELISVNAAGQRTSRTVPTFSTSTTGQPPAISQIRIDSALSPGEKVKVQTIVSWTTDIPSTSQVHYRTGVGRADEALPESTTLDGNFTKRHVVVITSFDPGAVYQLRVESKDSNGQVATSKAVTTLTPQQEQTVFQVITNTFQQVFGWTQIFNR